MTETDYGFGPKLHSRLNENERESQEARPENQYWSKARISMARHYSKERERLWLLVVGNVLYLAGMVILLFAIGPKAFCGLFLLLIGDKLIEKHRSRKDV